MRTVLHIDRLVLDGVTLSAAEQAAFEAELARLIADGGIALAGAVPSVRAPSITLGGDLGPSIAQSVYASLGGRASSPAPAGRPARRPSGAGHPPADRGGRP